jgi:hypothetical protein
MLKDLFKSNTIVELQSLKSQFELLSLKIATGSTLEAALHQQKHQPIISKKISRQWSWLRENILNGRIPPRAGVNAFIDLIEVHIYCQSENQKRGLNAKIQSRVLGLLCVFTIMALSWIMNTPLWSVLNLISLSLVSIGYLCLNLIARRSLRQLWRLDWMMFWFYVGTLIEWGMTPAQSFIQSLGWCDHAQSLPNSMRESLQKLAKHLRLVNHELKNSLPSSINGIEKMDIEIISQFGVAASEGLQTSSLIKNYTLIYKKWMQEKLQATSETNSYLNLVPLYFCFVPAIFLVLIGQIILNLSSAKV